LTASQPPVPVASRQAPVPARGLRKSWLISGAVFAVLALAGAGYGLRQWVVAAEQRAFAEAGSRTLGTPFTSPAGSVKVWTPSGWTNDSAGIGDKGLSLRAPTERFELVVVSQPGSDAMSLAEYLQILQKSYAEPDPTFQVERFDPATPFTIGGQPALRARFYGTAERRSVHGYLYATRSPTTLHQFFTNSSTLTPIEDFALVERIVANAELAPRGPTAR
jgi:hypothetical protein